jgi:hypothetical protein
MNRILTISAAVCALALAGAASAQTAAKSADAKPAAAKKKEKAKPEAKAPEVALSANQLEIAKRVYLGKADCEFNQNVTVSEVDGKPGMFRVAFKSAAYVMVPEETTTGAVRLEDKKNGIVWLQIANKSMMMNQKIGQRVVDGCTHPQQRS